MDALFFNAICLLYDFYVFKNLYSLRKLKYIIQLGDPDSRIPWASRQRLTNYLLNIQKFILMYNKN